MDFSIIERLIDSIIRNLSYERNAAQYASLITLIIRTVVCFITIFGLMTATSAFGHLFGTKRIWGEFIFVVAVIIVFFVYAYFMQNMYISFETAAFYIDTAVEFAVTAGFLYFTNHIFTKKLNVL
jgi:cation transport ATPase